MPRKRENFSLVLNSLEEGPKSFSEIKKGVQKHNPRISDSNISYVLSKLKQERRVHKNGKEYRLSEAFYVQSLREAVLNTILKTNRIYKIGVEFPAIGLDDREKPFETEDFAFTMNIPNEILRLAFSRLDAELHGEMFYRGQESRAIAEELFARTLWTGYLMSEQRLKESKLGGKWLEKARKQMYERGWVKPAYSEIKNLKDMMEQVHQPSGPVWSKVHGEFDYTIYMKDVFNNVDKSLLEDFSDQKLLLLGYLATDEAHNFDKLEKIQGNIDENLDFVRKHKSLLKRIIDKVKRMKFLVVISVGYNEIEKAQALEPVSDFESWLVALKAGNLDHRPWIFAEGAKKLKRAINSLSKGRIPDKLKIDIEPWDLQWLYKNHPKGKSIEFYKKILEIINERRKEIIKKEGKWEEIGIPREVYEEYKAMRYKAVLKHFEEYEKPKLRFISSP